jgi:hypothetical protein
MTDTDHATAAKKKLGDDKAAREKASKEREKTAAATTPTPTQEENDLAAMGVPVTEHEDDGSGPDPNTPQAKQTEAKPAGGYQTRTATAKA